VKLYAGHREAVGTGVEEVVVDTVNVVGWLLAMYGTLVLVGLLESTS
jgi:hypothetical protein